MPRPFPGIDSMKRLRIKRYLFTGLLTFIPLWVTWWYSSSC